MLDQYFLYGPRPEHAEIGTYDPWLVFLSYVVATIGSYTGLILALQMAQAKTRQIRDLLHIGGAFSLGSGIWSMHFIGMLAFKMNMVMTYDPWLTLLSMIIAVGIAWGVLA